MSAFTTGRGIEALRVLLFIVVALLALRNSLVPQRTARLVLAACWPFGDHAPAVVYHGNRYWAARA